MINKIENKSKILTYLVMVFFAATPLDYVLPHIGPATVLLVLGVIISFFALSLLLGNPKVDLENDQVTLIFLAVFIILSNLWAKDGLRAYNFTFSFVATAAMYCLLFFFSFSKKEIEMFETASIVGGALFVIYIFTMVDLSQVMAGYRLDMEHIGESQYFSDPNGLAARLMMPMVLIVKRLFEPSSKGIKTLYLVLLGSMIYIIFLTGSRASIVTLAAIFFIIFLRYGKNRLGLAVGLVIVGIAVIIFLPQLLPTHIYDRIFNFEKYQEVTTLEGDRIDIWTKVVTKLFPESPIWGVGAGNSSIALAEFYGRTKAVHSSWFTMLGDLGLVGFLPWISIAWGKLKQGYKMRDENIYVFAIILSALIMASTLDSEREKYLWNAFFYVHLISTMYTPEIEKTTAIKQDLYY